MRPWKTNRKKKQTKIKIKRKKHETYKFQFSFIFDFDEFRNCAKIMEQPTITFQPMRIHTVEFNCGVIGLTKCDAICVASQEQS